MKACVTALDYTSPEIYETYRALWDAVKTVVKTALKLDLRNVSDETRDDICFTVRRACELRILRDDKYLPCVESIENRSFCCLEEDSVDTLEEGDNKLISPLLITGRSVTFAINDGGRYYVTAKYDIYLNDSKVLETEKVINSLYELMPDTDYVVKVCVNGQVAGSCAFRTKKERLTINVRHLGAKGDGVSDDTHFIQAAILACPEGGRVLIPSGVYRITQIFLKSHISIELCEGAELRAFTEREKFVYFPPFAEYTDETDEMYLGTWEGNPLPMFAGIVSGIEVCDVTIYGRGTLNGNATKQDWWLNPKVMRTAFRPRLFFLNGCKNVYVQGIKFCNSPSWTIHPFFSDDLGFYDIVEENPADSPNTDGLDPESCKNVDIVGVRFTLGDDCIAVKSGKIFMGRKFKKPSENIHIYQCLMENGHGAVTIGSEMSGGVKNLTVEDCIFRRTDRGLRIKTRRGRGEDAVVENITFKNLDMDNVMTPFVANSFYFCDPDGKTDFVQSRESKPVDEGTPHIKSLNFINIKATNCHVAGAYLEGLPEKKIDEVRMENIDISFSDNPKRDVPAMSSGVEACSLKGIYVNNVKRMILKNVKISGQSGEPVILGSVDEVIR
ncbi:MAG: glycoside hydrolase family 28 protein [Lachnospiraceae bacterium]|nr:glycoside hydrolase family 28 protein [Lachnospiraceae bacterium]